MRPLIHLKQVNTKYNCNTAMKHKNAKTGHATHIIQYHLINNNRYYLLNHLT